MSNVNKRIAIVGLGYWGKNLVRNFSQLGVLDTICDLDSKALAKYKNEYNVVKTTTEFKDVINDKNVDAVVVSTPAVTHYKIVKEALLSGKDVFVEKPLALEVKEAEDLVKIVDKSKRILMIDHILQYHPAVIKLKELIDNGDLGRIQYIYSNRLNIGKLRREENILWSFAPHDISVIMFLISKTPHKVTAFGEAYLQEGIYDTTVTNLSFSDKLKAHIFVSWLHPFKEQKLVVIGTKNMAVFNDVEEKNKLVLYPHKVEWVGQIPVASKAEAQVVSLESKEPLKEACLHFIDCITRRLQPKTDAKEALSVLKVLQQAQQCLDRSL